MSNPKIENSAKAVITRDAAVLLVRHVDTSDMRLGTWYALPGGRQRFGETIEETVVRECAEELGARVTVGRLLFVREYIHARHELAGRGRDQHKVELMFLCALHSELHDATEADPDQESVEWVRLDRLPDIKIFPTGLHQLGKLLEQAEADPYWGDMI